MPKPKNKKGTPEDFIKEIDEQINSGKLTEEEKRTLNELKDIINASIENGDFIKKKFTFKVFLLYVCRYISEFAIAFLFVLVMFGITFSFLKNTNYLPLMIAGLSLAFGFVITGTIDYLRLLYDKIYLSVKIILIILKYFVFALINTLVFELYDPMIFLFITILVSDICASYVSRKLLKWWRIKWKSLFL